MARTGEISRALASSLRAAALLGQDLAAVQLAKKYAAALDADPSLLPDLGPKLVQLLDRLGMTPAGRGVKGGQGGSVIASKLDEFTARRAARKHPA